MEKLTSAGFTVSDGVISRNGRHIGVIGTDCQVICDMAGIGEANLTLLRNAGYEPVPMSPTVLAIINGAVDRAMADLGLAS